MKSSHEASTTMACPKTILSVVASVGVLAVFLIFVSLLLVSQPIGSAVRGYFYGVDHFRKFDSLSWVNETLTDAWSDGSNVKPMRKSNSPIPGSKETAINSQHDENGSADLRNLNSSKSGDGNTVIEAQFHGKTDVHDKNQPSQSIAKDESSNLRGEVAVDSPRSPVASKSKDVVAQKSPVSGSTEEGKTIDLSVFSNETIGVEKDKPPPDLSNNSGTQTELNNIIPTSSTYSDLKASPVAINTSQTGSVNLGCDLYHGKWVHDSSGPLYTNDSCPVLTQTQNCQGNGRPDKDYENWRWKPVHCDLSRFDGKKFLGLMRGKTIAFIGDSVARNQMESMLCILWQVEVPKNRGNKKMQRYFFSSTSTMVIRIWSSWLVHQTSERFDYAPEGVVKLHLDAPDEGFMDFVPNFDVIVLSSGHWFAKQSVYILNNEIVGAQLWRPDKSQQMKINSIEAFGISVETVISAIITHPNFTGLAIVRSYSPDHYEGGSWNTGGSCTGKVTPASDGELVENGFTKTMHEKQAMGFKRAVVKRTNKSKMRLMDITNAFQYRHDGHPGPYRSTDPHKLTKRGPDGRPPPQDCLHWCMPGPVDTWNEMVLEIIRREFEGTQEFSS